MSKSQSNSILNYFKRTPKTDSQDEATPGSANIAPKATGGDQRNGSETPRTSTSKVTPQTNGSTSKMNGSSRRRPLFESETPRASKRIKTGGDSEEKKKPQKDSKKESSATNGLGRPSRSCKKRAHFEDEMEEEDEEIVLLDDDSEEDYKPAETSEDSAEESEGAPEEEVESPEEEEDESPIPRKSRKTTSQARSNKPKQTPRSRQGKKERSPPKDDASAYEEVGEEEESVEVAEEREWPHLKYDFLQLDKIRDAKGRKRSHPDYDPKTLFIPESFLNERTPAHRQWWELKSQYFDTIFFFKVGKFYELFHMDAVIAKDVCGLTYMRGDHAHVGFPEIGYKKFAGMLLKAGYKVARIEQTETPAALDDRLKEERKKGKKITKFDKVVSREVCRITTAGTRVGSVLDPEPKTVNNEYLFACVESIQDERIEYGVCFVDSSMGQFWVGQFQDDENSSRLKTLLTSKRVIEFLLENIDYSERFKEILALFPDIPRGNLRSKVFPSSDMTLKMLEEGNYFESRDKQQDWPLILDTMRNNPSKYDLAWKAFGGVVSYLKESLIEYRLLTMKKIKEFIPEDLLSSEERMKMNSSLYSKQKHLILDWTTLRNLEIFCNTEGESRGTLYSILNRCSTPFGKRGLRDWLAAPLCDPLKIQERYDASDQLGTHDPFVRQPLDKIKKAMRKLPDFERLLPRLHNLAVIEKDHPENRANMFEADRYSELKIKSFLVILEGFKIVAQIQEELKVLEGELDSPLLKKITRLQPEGQFPDLTKLLEYFDTAFDHEEALKRRKIIPRPGVSQALDAANETIEEIKARFEEYRKQQEKSLGIKINFKHGYGTNRYHLEVSETFNKQIPHTYKLESTQKSKKLRRYSTERTLELLKELVNAEAQRDAAIQDQMREIFAQFDAHFDELNQAVSCIKTLDILLANGDFKRYLEGRGAQSCRAEIITNDRNEQILELKDVVNPILIYDESSSYIPNDIKLSEEVLLLTGPNMGGKSSLMRTVALSVILAQMGFYVPASTCRMTIVDRIFTRLGCRDEIFQNLSTFAVELKETKVMLTEGARSNNSLILLDELGRGTSTHDGIAIAAGVLNELLSTKCCRVIFSTHYHSLADEFGAHPKVKLGHMACKVDNIGDDDDVDNEKVTFLYKLAPGVCPKSYGFNVAKLANIPLDVVKRSREEAAKLERRMIVSKLLKSCIKNSKENNIGDIDQIVKQAQNIALR